eukprot:9209030-Alexandrium_andersonii.AAC.1
MRTIVLCGYISGDNSVIYDRGFKTGHADAGELVKGRTGDGGSLNDMTTVDSDGRRCRSSGTSC